MLNRFLRGTAALAAVIAVTACDTDRGDTVDSLALRDTTPMDTQIAAGVTADGWNDAQIIGLLSMVNGGRMAAAELARSRATSQEVTALVDTIDRAHVELEQQLSALAARLSITPAPPDDSSVVAEQNEDLAELQRQSAGAEWDREFVDELEDWQEDARVLLTRAIESTHTPELRQALLDMRTRVEQHLTQARALKDRLD